MSDELNDEDRQYRAELLQIALAVYPAVATKLPLDLSVEKSVELARLMRIKLDSAVSGRVQLREECLR